MKFDRRHQCGGRDAVEVKLSQLQSEFLFDLSLALQSPLDIGLGPEGHRLIIMTAGGHFQGPRLSGNVLPLTGADWPGSGRMEPSLSMPVPASGPPKAR
ncbi:MAG: hypothetical protein QOJ15_5671 [Bradyrhizobium sp.]|nr:hypothetical protein [Bradyrhizobium sp.]